MNRPQRIGFAVVGAMAALSGCAPSADAPASATPPPGNDRIDRLRALPYAGDVENPDDTPGGVVRMDPARSSPGYNLYSVQMLGLAELIDARGNLVRRWQYGDHDRWENCELLPDGGLLVVGATSGHKQPRADSPPPPVRGIADDARYLLRLDRDNKLVWKRRLHAHHDVELTPAGQILVLTFERVRVAKIHPTVPVRDDHLTLLDADGNVVASHSMLQAVNSSPAVFPLHGVRVTALGIKPWVDVFHANSIEWMRRPDLVSRNPIYGLDNILVCFRHQDRIAVFNWPHNRVLWTWGTGELSGPHDAHVLDNGNILLFDNGLARGWSRAVEMNPASGDIVWQYKSDPPRDFFSRSKGSVQRLPNGNTLMAESDKGRAIEVTPAGEIVWEFFCPHETVAGRRAAIVRMKRYPRRAVADLLK